MDPLSILMIGAGALVFREINRKDYGILTPSRDERYRNCMEYCYQPEVLLEEARLFDEYGLKAQGAMLRRRAEWRSRPPNVKEAHEEVYQKALASTNIPGILQVAAAFEGWTATKKAAALRERARILQEELLQEAMQQATNVAEVVEQVAKPAKKNGTGKKAILQNNVSEKAVIDTNVSGDDL